MVDIASESRELCDLIRMRLGVDYEFRLEILQRLIQQRVIALGCYSVGDYLSRLERPEDCAGEMDALASLVAPTGTRFFREARQLQAFAQLLSTRVNAAGFQAPLRIWSAGCATGEEPLSVAMAFAHYGSFSAASLRIFASDVSDQALEVARAARYSAFSVATIEPHFREYFLPVGDEYTLTQRILACVEYANINLLDTAAIKALPQFDVIFCRNVILYFAPHLQRQILASLAEKLCDDGYLLLGHSDSRAATTGYYKTVGSEDALMYQPLSRRACDTSELAGRVNA